MMTYFISIKYAILIFPLVALLFAMPFILRQYHKFGSISLFKSVVTYLFVFYLICAYFLVILPLPKIEEVAQLTTPRMQWIPFHFVVDFMRETSFNIMNPHTYLKAIRESCFFVVIFNILLTVPFGMMQRYYFKCNVKVTVWRTFLLSLFFELTQLSGLYFIYPRGYRLFDVDDLILNTLGGMFGYFMVKPIFCFLPSMDEIECKSRDRGRRVSGFRRTLAVGLDLFIFIIILLIVMISYRDSFVLNIMIFIVYYLVIPFFLGNCTLGEKYLNITIVDDKDQRNVGRLFLRRILFLLMYLLIPFGIFQVIYNLENVYLKEFVGFIMILVLLLIYFISFIKFLFTNKDMLYEKLSKTRMVSTIMLEKE